MGLYILFDLIKKNNQGNIHISNICTLYYWFWRKKDWYLKKALSIIIRFDSIRLILLQFSAIRFETFSIIPFLWQFSFVTHSSFFVFFLVLKYQFGLHHQFSIINSSIWCWITMDDVFVHRKRLEGFKHKNLNRKSLECSLSQNK